MYSGITGEEFAVDIYLGVVFYQRLRHMVNHKWQVRTTGAVDPVTRQPVQVHLYVPHCALFANNLGTRAGSVVVASVSVKWSVTL